MSAQTQNFKINDLSLVDDPFASLALSARKISIDTSEASRLAFLTDPFGLAVERYKLLRHQLQLISPKGGLLLVTSPSPGDGKTLTSTNLAWSLAENKRRTCLLDLDLRRPGVSTSLGINSPDHGVVEVLDGVSTLSEAITQVESNSLSIMGVREPLASPSRYLTSAVLHPFLLKLRAMFDWVIIDMPPAIPMSDVAEVIPYVDGALMIIRSGQTKKSLIGPTLEVLDSSLWGVVLNDSDITGSGYYGYYGYSADRKQKKKP